MKFTIATADLRGALELANRAVPRRTVLPVLSNVLFDNGTVRATDLRTSVSVKVNVGGKFAVDAKQLLGVVSSFTAEDVTLSLGESRLTVQSGSAKSQLPLATADDFPAAPVALDKVGELTPDILHKIVTQVSPFVGSDERPVLSGVYLQKRGDETILFGSDGFRVGRLTLPFALNCGDMIVPVPPLTLAKLAMAGEPVSVYAGENLLTFGTDAVSVGTALIAGAYPAIDNMLPKDYAHELTFKGTDLEVALRLVGAFADSTTQVLIKSDGAQMNVSVKEQTGTADMDFPVTGGGTFAIALGLSFLKEAMSALAKGVLTMKVTPQKGPAVFTSAGDQAYMHYLMQRDLPRE